MQVNDAIQVIKTIQVIQNYCSLSIVMQVNDVIQVIKTIVRYLLQVNDAIQVIKTIVRNLLLCKLMMLYKLSRLLFVIYCYASYAS